MSIKPGDLVRLDSTRHSKEIVEYYGLGLYLERKDSWDCVYWFKRSSVARSLNAARWSSARVPPAYELELVE